MLNTRPVHRVPNTVAWHLWPTCYNVTVGEDLGTSQWEDRLFERLEEVQENGKSDERLPIH